MKKLILTLITFFILLSCKSPVEQSKYNIKKKYFDYDQIDYYFNNVDPKSVVSINDNAEKSELNSIKAGLIIGSMPRYLKDTTSINQLVNAGYIKKKALVAKNF